MEHRRAHGSACDRHAVRRSLARDIASRASCLVSFRPAPASALVLTAGLGTRLQPLTSWRAKPALPVAGATLIERILEGLASQGVRDLVLNLHHLPETITMVLGDGTAHGVRIRYSYEQPLLGSAGGPRRAFDLVEADRLWLVNGDTLAESTLMRWPRVMRRRCAVTMAVIPNPDPAHYSGVLVDGTDAVTGFQPPRIDRAVVAFRRHAAGGARRVRPGADGVRIRERQRTLSAAHRGAARRGPCLQCRHPFLDIGTTVRLS